MTLPLIRSNRAKAIALLDEAIQRGGWVMDLRPRSRSDDQNRALHGLLDQILRQRTHHNGVKLDKPLLKAMFMQALGEEIRFVPTLDGKGLFPLGLKTSALSKQRFTELLELVLAWAAREGIRIEHFEDAA